MHQKAHKWENKLRKYKFKVSYKATPGFESFDDEGECIVYDWCDRLWGKSWGDMGGNPTAWNYAIRTGFHDIIPDDEEVIYVKIKSKEHDNSYYACLVHESELF